MNLEEYLKTKPKRAQERFWRGDRLFNYIIEKRCKHPEMLDNKAKGTARPKTQTQGTGK